MYYVEPQASNNRVHIKKGGFLDSRSELARKLLSRFREDAFSVWARKIPSSDGGFTSDQEDMRRRAQLTVDFLNGKGVAGRLQPDTAEKTYRLLDGEERRLIKSSNALHIVDEAEQLLFTVWSARRPRGVLRSGLSYNDQDEMHARAQRIIDFFNGNTPPASSSLTPG
jgi:hypothetical protein